MSPFAAIARRTPPRAKNCGAASSRALGLVS
jgi:hypothetical protein